MKKSALVISLTALFLATYAFCSEQTSKQFESSGEVTSADPVYSRVTIRHKPIEGFVGNGETEFFTSEPALLKGINRHDLVDFAFEDKRGDVRITRITKIGVAEPKKESFPIGQAVQGVLVSTGQAAKAVTAPIPAVNEVVGGAVGAATDATEPVLDDARPEIKRMF